MLRDLMRGLGRRGVPVVLQASATECGPACLAMVLGWHGRPMSVSELRDQFGTGRDGTKVRTLVAAARAQGLVARSFSGDARHLAGLPLPAIVHWNFNHYVVVERFGPRHVVLVDPSTGRRTVERAEFGRAFTGIVLTFEPGPDFQPRHGLRPSWRQLLAQLVRTQGLGALVGQVLLASLLLQGLGLALPLLTQVLVDRVLPTRLEGALPLLGGGLLLVVLCQGVLTYLRSLLLLRLQARFDTQSMVPLFEHLLRLPLRFFLQRTSGDILSRLGSSAVLRELLTHQTLSVVLDGGLVLTYLGVLLVRAPSFGAVALGIALAQVLLLLGSARRVSDLARSQLAGQAETQGFVVQALKGMALIKASGAESLTFTHWSHLFARDMATTLRRGQLTALVSSAQGVLRALALVLLLWLGAHQVLRGQLSLGQMLALQAIAAALLTPLASLVGAAQQFQLAGAHLGRLMDLVEAEPEPLIASSSTERLRGHIELRQVGFRHDAHAPPSLRDISLTIEPGQKVAIVGRSGSGKSTLALLLLGLYPPSEGEVLFDGVPLSRLGRARLRSQVGVVLQEPFLFSGSVRQNICLNDTSIALEQVMEAARLAAVDQDIQQMPMRYETWLGEGGGGLSGGQRQRLALARALANRPSILLLDEATSHLDVATEAQVDANLSALSCTRLVIAHRLSTIRNADLIVVLDAGRIVERGTHEQLLALGGHYAALLQGLSQPPLGLPARPTGS